MTSFLWIVSLVPQSSPLNLIVIFVFKIKTSQKFAPHLKFVNLSAFSDGNPRCNFPWKIKADISIYHGPVATPNTKTNSMISEIFIKFKWSTTDNPFCDLKTNSCPSCFQEHQSFVCNTKAALDTLGQITSYATAQLGAQFRTCLFYFDCEGLSKDPLLG